MDKSTRTIAKNIGALLMSQLTTWALTLAVSIFLPRYLGPAQIGQYYLALSIWAIMMVLAKFGTEIYATKEIARDHSRMPELVGSTLMTRTILFIISAIVVGIYTTVLNYPPTLTIVVALIGLSGYIELIAMSFAGGFSGREEMGIVSISHVVFKVISTSLAFLMMFLKLDVVWIASNLVIAAICELAVIGVAYFRNHTIKWPSSPLDLVRLLRLSAPYLMASLVVVFYNEVDKQIIATMIDEQAVGYYTTAATLFGTVMFIPMVFTSAIFPKMARAYTNTPETLPAINRKSLDIMFLLGMPVSLGIMAVGPQLITLIYGAEFAPAGPILSVLGVVIIFVYQNILISQILTSTERVHWWTVVMIVSTIVTIILDIVLVPWCQLLFHNGALAGAITYLLTEAAQTSLGIFLLPKGTLRWSNVRVAASALGAGLVMVGACWLVRDFFVLVPVLVGALTYISIILVFRVIPSEDMVILKQLASQLIARLRPSRGQVSPT